MRYILLCLLLSSCALHPTLGIHKIEYCKKVGNRIYCKDGTVDIGLYPGCSIYDESCN